MSTPYSNLKYAEIEKPLVPSERRSWHGVYKGIRFEINKFEGVLDFKNSWTHYIQVDLDKQLSKENADSLWLPPKYDERFSNGDFANYNYFDSVVSKIEFHGGCTYYSKESGVDDKARIVKIGCDYQHLWDEGNEYDENYVFAEVKKTIDSFVEHFGPVKIRSWGDGKYRLIEEFTT